jgi:ATP-dependent exoDNAse (exonuclease V) beta subunit
VDSGADVVEHDAPASPAAASSDADDECWASDPASAGNKRPLEHDEDDEDNEPVVKIRSTLGEVLRRNQERDALEHEDMLSRMCETAARELLRLKRERDALEHEDMLSRVCETAARQPAA